MKLTILSPTNKIIYENVDKILLDSEAGEVEVLPHHQKMISALNIGVAKITINDKKQILVINGGVIKIENDEMEILTSEMVPSEDIIKKDIQKALLLAEQKLSITTIPTELIRIEKEIKYQKLKEKMAKI